MDITLLFTLIILVVILLWSAIRIVQEYERGVIFRLGRLVGAKGPGLFLIIPYIDRMVKIGLRVVALDVPTQEAITKDNVTLRVNAVVYYRVVDAAMAVVNVEDYRMATWQIAQTSLRNVIGQSELDDLLAERERINLRLQEIIDEATEPWGVKVSVVEVKDVELPDNMKRAMARQAEAERERRSKVINAEGEYQAAKQLSNAAAVIATAPGAMQLRYLQTLSEIAAEHNSTILFPVPMNLIEHLSGQVKPGTFPLGGLFPSEKPEEPQSA
jgi:regulator of protease activity HflC (stomatin/prohibitin superfamily)